MIYKKCGDCVADCDACGKENDELFVSFSDPNLWICEECLQEDFAEAFENWKGEHLVNLDAEYEEQEEQAQIDAAEQYKDMMEDD